MLQLLYPIGLLAIAGVVVPLIIHLWNIKSGKTLKIGSISLLGESASQTAKSFKITDWPLLLLRCLLILLLAFLLAGPYLKTNKGSTNNRGWILIKKEQLRYAYQDYKTEIDSLLKAGYELHSFNPGFEEINLNDTAINEETVDPDHLTHASLLRQLNEEVAPGFNVYLYADKLLKNYSGDVAGISYHLKWRRVKIPDAKKTWVSNAYLTDGDDIRALVAASDSLKTAYRQELVTAGSDKKGIILQVDSGRTQLKTAGQQYWAEADTSTLNILICDQTGSGDGNYIRSAISAIQQFTLRKISIKNSQNLSVVPPKTDLIFWLAEKPVGPDRINNLNKQASIFYYATGPVQNINSVINIFPLTANTVADVGLYKRFSEKENTGTALWTDGFGKPLLTAQTGEKYSRFRFYSRFNPQWTDMVWSGHFVKALMPVILKGKDDEHFGFEINAADQRAISNPEELTRQVKSAVSTTSFYEQKPLDSILWVLAFIVFIIERIWSFRKSNMKTAAKIEKGMIEV